MSGIRKLAEVDPRATREGIATVIGDKGRDWPLVAVAAALAIVASSCTDGANDQEPDDAATERADSETSDDADARDVVPPADGYCEAGGAAELVWVHEREPPHLHLTDPSNDQKSITSWIRQAMLEAPYGVSAGTTFIPELVESESFSATSDGWLYQFTLRDDTVWSDGEPLTAEDVKGTYDLIMEGYAFETDAGGDFLFGSRDATGYALIDPDSWEVDGQTYSFTTEEFFSGVRALFDPVYPTHIIPDARTANEALPNWELDGVPLPSSGPMVFGSWDREIGMTLMRNDDYHGVNPANPDVSNAGAACVDGVRIDFVSNTDEQVNSLLAGEADIIMTQPQVAFGERIVPDDNVTVASEAGPTWEHWGFNLNNEHLSDPDVREAIAFSLDKRPVIRALYTPLFEDLLPEIGLGNVYWMSHQPDYVDHQAEAGYGVGDVDSAALLFDGAGYERNEDGIWEHPDLGTLTLRVGTTAGNQIRELQLRIMQEQLREAGVGIDIDNVLGSAYYSERPFTTASIDCARSGGEQGDCTLWDITQFAWIGGPWPGIGHHAFLSESRNNVYGYRSEEFDRKAAECDATFDDDERSDCYNTLSQYVTTRNIDDNGLVVLPITQKPAFFAYSNVNLIEGAVAPDARSGGPLVNVVDYLPAG